MRCCGIIKELEPIYKITKQGDGASGLVHVEDVIGMINRNNSVPSRAGSEAVSYMYGHHFAAPCLSRAEKRMVGIDSAYKSRSWAVAAANRWLSTLATYLWSAMANAGASRSMRCRASLVSRFNLVGTSAISEALAVVWAK